MNTEACRAEYRNIRNDAIKRFKLFNMTAALFDKEVAKFLKVKTPVGYVTAAEEVASMLEDEFNNEMERQDG